MLQDRTTMSAEELIALRNQFLVLMANYVVIDRNWMEMDIKQSGRSLLLTASVRVPIATDYTGEGEEVENPQRLLPSPRRPLP